MSPQTASFWDCIVISVAFVWLFCVFSNESLDFLPKKIQNHIGCISLLFSTVGFQMSPQLVLMRWYIFTYLIFSLSIFSQYGVTFVFTSLFWVFSYEFANCWDEKMWNYTGCICLCFKMSPQTVCLRDCIITLIAFVWLFSNVRFKCVHKLLRF